MAGKNFDQNNKAGAKFSIYDLKYIVMEGGGGKGAAYCGAIKALEQLISERFDAVEMEGLGRRKPAILDYYLEGGDNTKPIIEGLAGASAGAITTFALALGLNSEEIEQVLKYDFDNFLANVDVGKYRMINQKGELSIGEDTIDPKNHRKIMGEASKFEFQFDKAETKIGDNSAKKYKNELILTVFFKVISDGIDSNLPFIKKILLKLWEMKKNEIPFYNKLPPKLVKFTEKILEKLGFAGALRLILFKIILPKKTKVPINFSGKCTMAMVFDRGMFSGFAVREFFMDLVIYAATRETIFYRGLINYFENKIEKNDVLFDKSISVTDIKLLLKYKNTFDIADKNRRINSKIYEEEKLKNVLDLLSKLTFKQLYEITKVNFGLSVTNYTTGMPLYFGHEWTPDFIVMEAVGASMSIPPAIKPLYNEADVMKTLLDEIPLKVKTETGDGEVFIKTDGTFDVKDYYFYEHIVKMALAQEMEKDGDQIDINNTIEISGFLTKLRKIVVGEFDHEKGEFKLIDTDKSKTPVEKKVNGKKYIVDYALYKFFYNATYKGLLVDGGYRNNIPYNFFREKGDKNELDNILALKLDGSFPEPLMEKVYKEVAKYIDIENVVIVSGYNTDDPEIRYLMLQLDNQYSLIREKVRIIFKEELKNELKLEKEIDKIKWKEIKEQIECNNDAIDKLTDKSIDYYRKNMQVVPWKQPKSVFNMAFEGYQYGNEKGQIKDVSDYSHIISLYSYGIDVYDFKMNKIKPLVALSQAKAEEKVKEFFK
ncbi:MAG TPA: hypothetical protein GX007_02335 [Bacteroidales bacterium]|jgi:predicted acylesterase/phospholipase RssA|nr:hypothetical protein [Bacteroidales bacterium]